MTKTNQTFISTLNNIAAIIKSTTSSTTIDSTHSGHRLQVKSTKFHVHPSMAAVVLGRIAVCSEKQPFAVVPEAAFGTQLGRYENRDGQVRFILRTRSGEDRQEWITRSQAFANGSAVNFAKESLSSFPSARHPRSFDEWHLSGHLL